MSSKKSSPYQGLASRRSPRGARLAALASRRSPRGEAAGSRGKPREAAGSRGKPREAAGSRGEAGRGSSRGKVFVVSGPSGSGKSTLLNKVQSKREFLGNLVKIVTVTTRQPRKGEKNGRDYRFLDKDEFLRRLKNKEFAESEEVFGKYYATPKEVLLKTINQGRDALLCVDVRGARSIRRAFPQEAILIFISVADIEKLRQRLRQRSTETKEGLKRRLKIAQKELTCAKNYDYIVNNDILPEAVKNLSSIITAERLKVK